MVESLDAMDLSTSDMKAMNHVNKYVQGIMDHINANPDVDPEVLSTFKTVLVEYRDNINSKHGEAQGKSDFISLKADDINRHHSELLSIEDAITKAKEIRQLEEANASANNVLSDNQNSHLNQAGNPQMDGWQQTELTITQGAMKLIGFCLKVGVGLPCHAAAAVIGSGAGLVLSTSQMARSSVNSHKSNMNLVDIAPDTFVTKQKEINNIEAGSKLLDSLRDVSTAGVALSSKGAGVIKSAGSDILSLTTNKFSQGFDFASNAASTIRDEVLKKVELAKKEYEDSCVSLSVQSREKLAAVNDNIKKISDDLVKSMSTNLSSLSGSLKGWVSDITNKLSAIVANIKAVFQPNVAQNIAKGEVVVPM